MSPENHKQHSTMTTNSGQIEVEDSSVLSLDINQESTSNSVVNDENRQQETPRSTAQGPQSTLKEIFPTIEVSVIKAVLVASGGQLEPAFNALLSMSDPSAVEQPPPQPPRPTSTSFNTGPTTTTPRDQLDADALYAKQLQEHYGGLNDRRIQSKNVSLAPQRHSNDDSDNDDYYNDSEKEHSFFDDDLPVIKENIKKGFMETQTKFNSWLTDIKKRIDPDGGPNLSTGEASSQYARAGIRRRTAEYSDIRQQRSRDGGYDADPPVLSDDFTLSETRDPVASIQKRRPANPNLFQKSDKPKSTNTRSVSLEKRPTTFSEDDLYQSGHEDSKFSITKRTASPNAGSKWKPLKMVEPAPMDRDPFSLGDSDDEKDGLIKEVESSNKVTSTTSAQESGAIRKSA